MPLTPYKRGPIWWVKGRIEYDGRPVSDYYRCSTGASEEAGARGWIEAETARQIRRHILGEEAASITFAQAVLLYPAKPKEAGYLAKILPEIGETFVSQINPQGIRELGPILYPNASTDTWHRCVITPVSAVINNAHDKGKCSPIRIRGYSAQERIDQDSRRGQQSRKPRQAGSWEWIRSVQPHANPWISAGIEFMFETGCRVGQLTEITPRDVDLAQLRVRLIAQKGHPAQWVKISHEMMIVLANLKPRRPHDFKRQRHLPARTFGYANRSGFANALRKACERAGVQYLTPHEAGRHGFATELLVRQDVPAQEVAAAGRWSDPALPQKRYAHAERQESQIRAAMRTSSVQGKSAGSVKALKQK